ncbi:CBS domain-containing protein [Sphingobacterium bovistauri]|uniref:CBS domain-containing protein n=1 Tax=Sphingobacterium bovistauri TaxID=2781959 RepID=A0ABS7ZC95_9SPHI|nr:CBS domain-containing protein [Sphingobacterium bovistauri]MCA5006549.1 CBS domain-containing protein [Sphingobacterium bovistauri]
MFIGQYISTDYHEVLLSDSIEFALNKMSDNHLKQLAVVNGNIYYGIITEDVLLDQFNPDDSIESIKILFKTVYLFDYQHIYDALQSMVAFDYCFIPILNKNHEYQGVLTKQDLLVALNSTLGKDDGAIIVLELGMRDNALSHIARIIEAENTAILSTAVHQIPDSTKLEMTIKVNKTNISAVISSLWRNDYVVKATFRDGGAQSDIQDRYDLLMNYLDL